MFSKRIEAIASLVDVDSVVVDVGTDHAYLPIYLYLSGITRSIIASDISENVLNYSLRNLEKYDLVDKIKLVKSDGLKDIKDFYNTVVIAGMGTSTIMEILSIEKLPKTIILQSNNDLETLRLFMMNIGYKLLKEIIVYEKDKYYAIMKYIRGKELLTKEEIEFGKSNDLEYLNYLLNKYKKIYEKSNDKSLLEKINRLTSLIEKIEESY